MQRKLELAGVIEEYKRSLQQQQTELCHNIRQQWSDWWENCYVPEHDGVVWQSCKLLRNGWSLMWVVILEKYMEILPKDLKKDLKKIEEELTVSSEVPSTMTEEHSTESDVVTSTLTEKESAVSDVVPPKKTEEEPTESDVVPPTLTEEDSMLSEEPSPSVIIETLLFIKN